MTSVSRLFTYLFILLFLESLILGVVFSTLLSGVFTGLILLSLPLWMLHKHPDSALTAHIVAAGCMMFSFLHIQQSFGLIEVHFEIFILMAVLIMFVEWRVFITALAFVAVHHLSFYYLQINDAGVYVFDPDRLFFSTVLIHAAYAIVEAIVAGYIAKTLQRERSAGLSLSNTTEQIMANENSINIGLRADERHSEAVAGFNRLLGFLSRVVGDVKSQSSVLKDQSNQLVKVHDELHELATKRERLSLDIAESGERVAEGFSQVEHESTELQTQFKHLHLSAKEALNEVANTDSKTAELANNLHQADKNISQLVSACSHISDLLNEISSIAEQTNLLALNAAIEAARAGEQGRGFAVVADEVRNLATRSKNTTDKITQTLESLLQNSASSTDSMQGSVALIEQLTAISSQMKQQISVMTEQVSLAATSSESVAHVVQSQAANTRAIAENSQTLIENQANDNEMIEKLTERVQLIDVSIDVLEQGIAKFK